MAFRVGNPWAALSAPHALAKTDISVKMFVPLGYLGQGRLGCVGSLHALSNDGQFDGCTLLAFVVCCQGDVDAVGGGHAVSVFPSRTAVHRCFQAQPRCPVASVKWMVLP